MLLAYAKSQRCPIWVRGRPDHAWPRLDPPKCACFFVFVGFVWICFLVLGGGGVEEVDIDNRGVRRTPNYRKIHTILSTNKTDFIKKPNTHRD